MGSELDRSGSASSKTCHAEVRGGKPGDRDLGAAVMAAHKRVPVSGASKEE